MQRWGEKAAHECGEFHVIKTLVVHTTYDLRPGLGTGSLIDILLTFVSNQYTRTAYQFILVERSEQPWGWLRGRSHR